MSDLHLEELDLFFNLDEICSKEMEEKENLRRFEKNCAFRQMQRARDANIRFEINRWKPKDLKQVNLNEISPFAQNLSFDINESMNRICNDIIFGASEVMIMAHNEQHPANDVR